MPSCVCPGRVYRVVRDTSGLFDEGDLFRVLTVRDDGAFSYDLLEGETTSFTDGGWCSGIYPPPITVLHELPEGEG